MSKAGFQTFAAGMIVATSILGGTFLLTDNKSATADTENKELSAKDVENYLTSNGKISITTDEYEQLLETKNQALQQQALQTEQKSTEKQETAEKETPVEKQEEQVIKYKLTVNAGMTTNEISNLLEQNGIVEDSFKFDQYLIKNGHHQKIQLGTFDVEKGMDFYQLAQILTN